MRKISYLAFSAVLILFSGCERTVTETVTYKINEPVFMAADAFRSSVKVTEERHPISDYGKICLYNSFLYIAESGKGIHIINNRNPSEPQIAGFIELLGNVDLAIKDNLLYADSFIDLVWFDLSDPSHPVLKGRLEDAFPRALPPIENDFGYDFSQCFGDENRGIIVGWNLTEQTVAISHTIGGWIWGDLKGDDLAAPVFADNGGASQGVNGSMSRFSIHGGYLYTVLENEMNIFDLSEDTPVKAARDIYIGNNVETIFYYKENMFMGTPVGLLIYSIEHPLNPAYQSMVSHIYGCDPVVVADDIAYVTVRSGNLCGQTNDQLIVIDVSDVKNPVELVSYKMTQPKGLGVDKGLLFLCDEGLKIFKTDDPQTIVANRLKHYPNMDGYDVIPFNNVLMMIADNGLYQYDYSDITNIKELSLLPFSKN
ncbi:MAG: hypothetical protein LBH80_06180 [Prevotellaceae bacterium]|jgi:hypothetical protein|nr:hypothetical protein [Prevotellaceae bacterium]